MTGVRSNLKCTVLSDASGRSSTTGMFDRATRLVGTIREISNVALMAGSSQQGKQRRASVASNCVTPAYRSSPLAAKLNRQGGTAGRDLRPEHEAGRFLSRIELYVLGGELLVAERNRRRAELQVQCVERNAIRCFHDLKTK
uniref:Uncharacterized protein n=1 Tax=Anopheles melas TaxID=34690 RepID=A0A182TJD9_9DIPT